MFSFLSNIYLLLYTTRKGVVYLVEYSILYRLILFHERISKGLTLDLL